MPYDYEITIILPSSRNTRAPALIAVYTTTIARIKHYITFLALVRACVPNVITNCCCDASLVMRAPRRNTCVYATNEPLLLLRYGTVCARCWSRIVVVAAGSDARGRERTEDIKFRNRWFSDSAMCVTATAFFVPVVILVKCRSHVMCRRNWWIRQTTAR